MKRISNLHLFPRAARTLLLMVAITLTALTAGAQTETYTVTYDLNGGYATDDYKTSYESGENFYISIYPYKPGYTFTGFTWEGQATPVKAPNFIVTSDMILTAHFTPNNTDKGLWCDYRDETWGSDYATKNEFTISTAAQLAQFAHMVNTLGSGDSDYKSSRYSFSGKTVTLTANIDLSAHEWVAIGYNNEVSNEIFRADFCGTFNGDGHTISGLYINQPGLTHQGLIGSAIAATIKNVILSNSTISGDGSVGGIAGDFNNGTIQDCHVLSDVTIKGRNAKVGAIVGELGQSGGQWGTATGCSSAATLIYEGAGGVAGDISGGGILKDCFYYGPDMNYGIVGYFAETGITHCFYTAAYSGFPKSVDSKEKAARVYSVTAGEGVAISRSKEPTATYYGGKLKFYGDDGCSFDGTEYYTQGTTLTVTPTAAYEGYHLNYNVEGTGASLNEGTLTVGTANVTVSAVKGTPIDYTITYNLDGGTASNPSAYTIETETFTLKAPLKAGYVFAGWTGTGLTEATKTVTIEKGSTGDRSYTATWADAVDGSTGLWTADGNTEAYIVNGTTITISNEKQLAQLAKTVNAGTSYEGYTITLDALLDLSAHLWVPIGTETHPFQGTFSGGGKRIQGLTVSGDSYQGLFGNVGASGSVADLVLDDSYIVGGNNTGGIAGYSEGKITNCHATSSVTIHGTDYYNHGGIVGFDYGTVEYCTSAAVMTTSGVANSTGGIAGVGQPKYCLYYGSTLPDMDHPIEGGSGIASSTTCFHTAATTGADDGSKLVFVYTKDPGSDVRGSLVQNLAHTVLGYANAFENGFEFNGKFYATKLALSDGETLSDEMLADCKGQTIDVAFNRSFAALGTSTGTVHAATICLPFSFTKPDATSVGKFYTFGGVTGSGDDYTVTMTEVSGTEITAGTPYMFVPAGSGAKVFENTAFTVPSEGFTAAGKTENGGWAFTGTYTKKTWESGQTRLYGFAGTNFKTGDGSALDDIGAFQRFGYGTTGAFRCYLMAPEAAGTRGSGAALPETMRVVLKGADGSTTAIGTIDTRSGEAALDGNGPWYTLSGQRLQGKPAKAGLYIHNNKKVVIK